MNLLLAEHSSLGYEFLGPAGSIGIIILIIGAFFTAMIFYIFFNVNQDVDSFADKRRKLLNKKIQQNKISRLYPRINQEE